MTTKGDEEAASPIENTFAPFTDFFLEDKAGATDSNNCETMVFEASGRSWAANSCSCAAALGLYLIEEDVVDDDSPIASANLSAVICADFVSLDPCLE